MSPLLLPLLLSLLAHCSALGQLQFRVSVASPAGQTPLQLELCAREFRWLDPSSSQDRERCKFGHARLDLVPPFVGEKDVSLSFTHSWRHSFAFSIQVRRSDGQQEVLFSRSERVFQIAPGSAWRSLTANFSANASFSLALSFRVACASNFFGPGCDIRCELSEWERLNGRFECSPEDGQKRCADGWTGRACAERHKVNSSSPMCQCANGGRCTSDAHGRQRCFCAPGFTGDRCEKCVTNSRCEGSCQVPGECECPEGRGGQFCEKDLVFCARGSPCRNGATCLNSADGSYFCQCAPGFTGRDCERRMTSCEETPCQNGANCTTLSSGGFHCECPRGLFGRSCQVRAPRGCADLPCQNGGSCAEASLLALAPPHPFHPPAATSAPFKCLCPHSWTGQVCDRRWESCAVNFCQNGGSCLVDTQSPLGFVCSCALGWEGPLCAQNVDDCRALPCLNGGNCVDELNAFRCVCRRGFGGELCQEELTGGGGARTTVPEEGCARCASELSSLPSSCLLLLLLLPVLVLAVLLLRSLWPFVRPNPTDSASSAAAAVVVPISTIPDPKLARPPTHSDDAAEDRYVSEPALVIGANSRRGLAQTMARRVERMHFWEEQREDEYAEIASRDGGDSAYQGYSYCQRF